MRVVCISRPTEKIALNRAEQTETKRKSFNIAHTLPLWWNNPDVLYPTCVKLLLLWPLPVYVCSGIVCVYATHTHSRSEPVCLASSPCSDTFMSLRVYICGVALNLLGRAYNFEHSSTSRSIALKYIHAHNHTDGRARDVLISSRLHTTTWFDTEFVHFHASYLSLAIFPQCLWARCRIRISFTLQCLLLGICQAWTHTLSSRSLSLALFRLLKRLCHPLLAKSAPLTPSPSLHNPRAL